MKPRCTEAEMNQMDYMNQGMDPNMNMNMDMNTCCSQGMDGGCMCPPVYECPTERVCERVIMHEVPQE